MWRTVYLLNRLREACAESSDEISALIETLERNSFANIEQVGLAARWVEAYMRQTQDDSD